jgi:diguanylate cyclase
LKQNTEAKLKYQNSVEELEKKESEWRSHESILRDAIARLCTVGRGLDKNLDRQLELIESLSRDKQDERLASEIEILLQNVNSLEADSNASNENLPTDPGLIKKSIDDVVSRLLERLSIIQDASDANRNLEENVMDGAEETILLETLAESVASISNTLKQLNQEKSELENFIANVTEQLGDLTRVVTEDREEQMSGHRQAISLQILMKEGMEQISDNVDAAEDISQWKSEIAKNIDLIKEGVEDFVGQDKVRNEAVEVRSDSLVTKIKQMEIETELLQQKLVENREKLLYDTLTGVRSRLAYDEQIEQEMARWERYSSSFSYAILDIDHFKNINDKYGHSAGDNVLKIIANMMSQQIRKSDFIFRIGGEEFVLILTNTDVSQAGVLVEKLRKAVKAREFSFNQERVTLSLSAGLTETWDGDSVKSIYERADAALYRAKNSGRDCQFEA